MSTLSITGNVATFGKVTATYTRATRETPWGIESLARFEGANILVSRAIAQAYSRGLARHGEVTRDGRACLVVDGYHSIGD